MKNRILDISDCSESPLLANSCHRYRHFKRPSVLRHGFHRTDREKQNSSPLAGLTEAYFKGVNPGGNLDFQLNSPENGPTAELVNVSYQARCAERWWAEFRRWFGSQN